jgi:hypothetical protein
LIVGMHVFHSMIASDAKFGNELSGRFTTVYECVAMPEELLRRSGY